MDDLLPYFERELVMLRRHCREFAERYPRIAGKLHMSGESCEDPHVEHLIESVAMLAARISKRLDDDYPQFTEALFEALFPHYLRPFPSCAIVHQDMPAPGAGARHLPANSELDSAAVRGVRCRFKTVYDMTTGTSTLEHASFDAMIKAPAGVRLPIMVSSSLNIVIRHLDAPPASLRVFINGEPSFAAALRDALFMRTTCAFVEAEAGPWIALAAVPLKPVGFAETEALIPFGARSQPAYRILSEYFAYPEKFNFLDIDIAALSAFLPAGCRCYTLHLGMAGLRPDSDIARMLTSISKANLLLGCSPVVNLFRQSGVPIAITRQKTDYAVLAHATHAHGYEVLGIDAVHLLRQRGGDSTLTEFRPLYSLRHGEGAAHHYWVLRHDEHLAEKSPGHEKKITLVDSDFNPLLHEKASLSLELTCSNRDLPLALKYGQPQGDLQPCSGGTALRLLRRPSPPRRFAPGFGLHWRLISHLTLNHHALAQEGLPALREMLTLYDLAQSATSQRLINGIAALAHQPATAWLRHQRGTSLVHGVELRMTLDEAAFVGSSMHLFVQVIDHFLGLYVQINSFIELIVLSLQSGEELIRCKPRSGLQNLV
ncbi:MULTISPECIES: type VI secretion system baseplate subunit TssF [unclassified Janthinobacterium]|uniref:type VI secretion system baseplate subunit TssF n=1 Tax=unclassified Janthinobacterium TaxID=2610881 RepID=UPI001620705F|nr:MULTISPECIES: type VI secretion system baseplate subunit TssF [unclassified Janthinobacterium]MBB5609893.1 type VI secretion system protein ImpG [Janthinobacterium sp. S3T4]MBB5615159.1 type VI secretion system protein ImpG [Janthinobacterium sp. S3M3]